MFIRVEGVGRQIQYSRWPLEVRSTWLRHYCKSGTAAHHLHCRRLLADRDAHLHAEEAGVQCESKAEDSSRHQLRSSCSEQRCCVQPVTLAAQTAAVTIAIPSVNSLSH